MAFFFTGDIMKKIIFSAFMLMGFASILMGCKEKEAPLPEYVKQTMNLVWSDEFDYEGKPDDSKWNYSIGNLNGWGNGEIQKYTDKSENVNVHNGVCTITALREGKSNRWTSARIKTEHKGKWTGGYIEVRANLPEGVGTWPAIWMMPEANRYGQWPRSGEIDIMEHVGFDKERVHATIHTKSFNHKIGTQKTRSDILKGATKGFHTYAVYWTQDVIRWVYDGETFYEFQNTGNGWEEWPFDHPFYLILNIAIGGTWGGQQGIDKELKKATMDIDFVRVYQ